MQHHRFLKITGGRLIQGILTPFRRICFGIACSLACALLGSIQAATAATDKISIITDIAPVHSLVSMVVGQHADVDLLIPPSQSPHSFSLKPSQIRIINNASMIVTLSDDFTPTLGRHLKSIDQSALVLQLSDSNSEHQVNEQAEFEQANINQENNGHNDVQKSDVLAALTNAPKEHINDAHTWLNPENAIEWIDRIAYAAVKLDEKNSTIYKSNASRAKAELAVMHGNFAAQLSSVRLARYIVYHDAYQHFAQSYGLQKPIAIALSDARAPGAKKLRAMRSEAKQSKCVFSELQYDDIVVDTVTAGLPVNRAILDPIGSAVPIGPNHYPQMMQALVNNFVACLN